MTIGQAGRAKSVAGTYLRWQYRIQWAALRGRPVPAALFVLTQALFALALLSVANGTIVIVGLARRTDVTESLARLILSAAFVNAISFSTVFRLGGATPLATSAVRRFPLSKFDRFVCSRLSRLLEP